MSNKLSSYFSSALSETLPEMKTKRIISNENEIESLEPQIPQRVKHIRRSQVLALISKKLIFLKRSWKNYLFHILLSLFLLIIVHIYSEFFGANVNSIRQNLTINAKNFKQNANTEAIVVLAINSKVPEYDKIKDTFVNISIGEGAKYTIVENQTLLECE